MKKRKQFTEEHIKNLSESHKGYVMPEEQKRKISVGVKKNLPLTIFKKGCPAPSTAFKKGHTISLETREKIGIANKGIKRSDETKIKMSKAMVGNKNGLGHTKSVEVRRRISKLMKGRVVGHKYKKGEKNPNWNDGSSFEPYGLEFNEELKEKIRRRDGYRCQQCFRHQDELYTKTGRKYKLPTHHIDYDKKNNEEKNLLSLCRNCHSQTNFGRKDWTDYFNRRIKT